MLPGKSGWRGLCIYLVTVIALTLAVEFPAQRMIGWLLLIFQLLAPSLAPIISSRILGFAMRAGWTPFFLRLLVPSFAPAIAWVVAKSATGEGFEDGSFRIRDRQVARLLLLAWVCPVVLGFAAYGAAWLAGTTRFGPTPAWYPFGLWGPEMLFDISIKAMPPLLGFIVRLVSCLLFSLLYCGWSFGIELGWRGYMLPKLVELGVSAPMFWTGLAWGLVYLPSMFGSDDGKLMEARWISVTFFLAGGIGLSYILGYLRLRSGSIWPAVLGYATWDCVVGMSYSGLTIASPFWKGELYLLSVALGAAALFLVPRPWKRIESGVFGAADASVPSAG